MSLHRLAPQKIATAATIAAVAGLGAYQFNRTVYAESNEPAKTFGRYGLTSLPLQSIKTVNHNTKRLVFELPDQNVSGLSLTSSLLVISRPQGSWIPVIRPYTPISDLNEPGTLELMIKKYPHGKSSTHLHSLQPGQTVSFLGPIPGYSWSPNQHAHLYLLAGGAGITPMYQLIRGALKNPTDRTKLTLVFGVNTEHDLVLRDELDAFQKKYPDRFDVVYTVTAPKGEISAPLRTGRVTEALLREVMGENAKGGRGEGGGVKVLVCGPPGMETALLGESGWLWGKKSEGILGRLGFEKGEVYKF